jgi:rod shape-determining protein MreC
VSAVEKTQHQQQHQRNTLRLLMYGILAVFLMALDHRGHYLNFTRNVAMQVILPLYQVVDWPQQQWQRFSAYLGVTGEQMQRIANLQQENQNLRAKMLRHEVLRQENERLRTLLAAVESTSLQVKLADIVAIDLDPYSHRIVINLGSSAGVRAGMSVVDESGLLGQISEVSSGAASVTLISDANHAIPLRNLRNGLRMIGYGQGDHQRLLIRDLPVRADLKPGDLLVTSGLGGRFPAGLLVAEVTDLPPDARADDGHFGIYHARPLAALAEASQVLVVE